MNTFWLVARQEFRTTVLRRSFLLLTLAIPLGLAAIMGLAYLAATAGQSQLPIGYVDLAGALTADVSPTAASGQVVAIAYPDQEVATAALERKEIQAFFVFPQGYPASLQTDLYYLQKPPSGDAWRAFDSYVRAHLVAHLPADAQERLLEGPSVTVLDVVSGREFGEQNAINIAAPFVLAFFFFFANIAASGYMLSVVAGEKENRTLEIMATTVSPLQLIGGKIVALLSATLLQLAVNVAATAALVTALGQFIAGIPPVHLPMAYLGLMALYFFPAYALLAGIMVAIGSASSGMDQGNQISGILNMVGALPLYLLPVLFGNPGHPLLVVLTLFPPTAFMSIALRWGLGTVPVWQLVVSWVLLASAAAGTVWIAARVYRASMLRYGQSLSLKGILAAIRG